VTHGPSRNSGTDAICSSSGCSCAAAVEVVLSVAFWQLRFAFGNVAPRNDMCD